MICTACVDGRESECWGLTKDKTWCDSQHYPKDTVILQAQFCKHLRAANNYCPTCGTVFDDTSDSGRDESVDSVLRAYNEGEKGITASPIDISFGAFIECEQCKEDPTREHNCPITGQTIEGPDKITSRRRRKKTPPS